MLLIHLWLLMYVTMASTLSVATFSCFAPALRVSVHAHVLLMVRISPVKFGRLESVRCSGSGLWNSHLLRAQQLHMRLQCSVNLSRPTCAAYQSRLLWSARLTSRILHCSALVSVFCLCHWFRFWLGAESFIYTESFFTRFPLRKFGMSLQ